MELILKVSGIGLFISVLNNILSTSGKGDWGTFVNLVGIVVVLGIVISEISGLLNSIKVMFML